MLFYPKNN
ncbi:hypothetical protein CGLO_14953 [Colletotrichum gloeosporioides Cg-14]|uniref:Uncharacterized protein n=1 Tax=Colletotrichum gloeosporioides (strain Cg-14) TaxID=1237896 RepID=T0K2V9_COLGC|nr:hypothetical protein CGLO_14953 [Colletotrichum gloeosporioides Cg-14]